MKRKDIEFALKLMEVYGVDTVSENLYLRMDKPKELTNLKKGINMTDQQTTEPSTSQPVTDINGFPVATMPELTAQVEAVLNLYIQFTNSVKDLKTAEVYKIRALAHLDDGWLWVEKGLQQAQLNAQNQEKATTSGSDTDKNTTSGTDTATTDSNGSAA